MRDVAKLAGVSIATVSAVLNKNKYVSDELTVKVNEAIKQLNYRPNKIASNLAKRRSFVLAYLIPTVTNLVFAHTLRGVEEVASKYGYTTILYNTDFGFERYKQCAINILEQRIDGVIITAPRSSESVIRLLQKENVPVVIVHSPRSIENVDRVFGDDYSGVYKAIQHLISSGRKKIGFVGVKESMSTQVRLQGYKDALTSGEMDYNEKLVCLEETYSKECGFRAASLLNKKYNVDAIFACSDIMAIGVLSALYNKVKIPEDVAIVSFDDTLALSTVPMLSAVSLPNYKIGEVAAKLLIKRIENSFSRNPQNYKHVMRTIPEQFIIRQTS